MQINSTKWRARLSATVIVSALLAAGCAAPVKEQERAGFISDYSKLEKTGNNAYVYTAPELSGYTRFLIDPVEFLFVRDEKEETARFTKAELEQLETYFQEQLVLALTRDDGYAVVEEAGVGVARVRHGLTALDTTTGVLNISIFTKITGAGLGGAAVESEVADSVDGSQLGAAIQWGNGSRILPAGITRFGDARGQMKRWSKALRKRIDAAHGLQPRSGSAGQQVR